MSDSEVTVPLADRKPPLVRAKTQLLHLPSSKPVDVIFQNIKLKVSSGYIFNKREYSLLMHLSVDRVEEEAIVNKR